jgi:hypothetical protein
MCDNCQKTEWSRPTSKPDNAARPLPAPDEPGSSSKFHFVPDRKMGMAGVKSVWKTHTFHGRDFDIDRIVDFLNTNNIKECTVVKQTQTSIEIVYKEG